MLHPKHIISSAGNKLREECGSSISHSKKGIGRALSLLKIVVKTLYEEVPLNDVKLITDVGGITNNLYGSSHLTFRITFTNLSQNVVIIED